MDNIKWVSKALAKGKDNIRETLKQLAYIDGKVIAADGFRLHAWTGESDITTPDKYPDIAPIFERAKSGQTTVEISKYHLVQACKSVHALLRGEKGYKKWGSIHLEVDYYMHCEAERKDKGTVRVDIKNSDDWPSKGNMRWKGMKPKYPKNYIYAKPHIVHYKHTGSPLHITLNPTFLIDALSGMDDIVTLTLQGWSDPVYIQAGDKEAVIMPMNMGR